MELTREEMVERLKEIKGKRFRNSGELIDEVIIAICSELEVFVTVANTYPIYQYDDYCIYMAQAYENKDGYDDIVLFQVIEYYREGCCHPDFNNECEILEIY